MATTKKTHSVQTARIFLSYASEDVRIATYLRDEVESGGFPCWFAPRDVVPGQEYGEAIVNALKQAKAFLLVYSQSAEKSPHVRSEIERAASLDIPILVFRIDATQPSDRTGFFLSRHHWLDGSGGVSSGILATLMDAVRQLSEKQTATTGVPAKAGKSKGESSTASKRKAANESPAPGPRSIGIDIGGSKIRGCLIDFTSAENPTVLPNEYVVDINHPVSARSVAEQVKGIVQNIYDAEGLAASPPIGIGVAAAGQVDMRAGVLKFSPALGVRNISFKSMFASIFPNIAVRVDNDVRCATRCELHLGAGKDYENFVCIFVGNGVGSGVAIERRILFGSNSCAGEIGHTKIASDGPMCNCGQTGCLETFVKAGALSDRARAKAIDWKSRKLTTLLSDNQSENTPRSVAAALEAGDQAAQEVADEIGKKLGIGIGNCLNMLNPDAVLMGGGLMSGFFMAMSDGLSMGIRSSALSDVVNTPIIHSQFSDTGASLGAALLFHPKANWPY
jgi:glucokinase